MTLQIINPEWLSSPEGKEWKKKMAKRHDKIIADVLRDVEIPSIKDENK